MFNIFDDVNENEFNWDSIGDVGSGRLNLGEEMPVFVYRLFQATIKDELAKRFGNQTTIEIFRGAGDLAGYNFAHKMLDLNLSFNEFMAQLQCVLEDAKIGVLRVEKCDVESGSLTLTIAEDLDCSGLPITGQTVCNYDEGFLAGVLKAYTKLNYVVVETDCWATGSRVCRFDAKVK